MRSPEQMIEDIQNVLADVEELARAVAGENGQNGTPAGNGAPTVDGLESLVASARTKVAAVKEGLVQRVQATDRNVHDNAWKLIGTAALIAFAAGLLIAGSQRGVRDSTDS
jgi:ElaB/YqjD/DUF883 family membrane-anchored ribosome-binding protein